MLISRKVNVDSGIDFGALGLGLWFWLGGCKINLKINISTFVFVNIDFHGANRQHLIQKSTFTFGNVDFHEGNC